MNSITTISDLQKNISDFKQQQKTIAFVPTMGKLHDGHLSLIKEAKKRADIIIVSIFVNPTQFGPNEDFDAYPRDLVTDLKLCTENAVDVVFLPTKEDLYGYSETPTEIYIPALSTLYCGKTRQNFFKGICSVVLRLFILIQPDIAIFGEKDYQQFIILSQMVRDLFLPIRMISVPIYREKNGLAMSSRNAYLNNIEQDEAATIFKALMIAKDLFQNGESKTIKLTESVVHFIQKHTQIKIDYCVGVDYKSLREKEHLNKFDRLLFAGYLNSTRLIDNIVLD
tara:strand:- start:2119 stop:2964 length:846 start_codon:yes stop_codon:yes gene_type:complete